MEQTKEEIEQVEVCDECGGSGEIRVLGYVYAGEPHMADIDVIPCPKCRGKSEKEYQKEE